MRDKRLIIESTFYSHLLDIKLWSMVSNNDLLSKWALYYSIVNKDYKNKQLINTIINYANTVKIGKNRSNALNLNLDKISSIGQLFKICSIP